MEDDTKVSNFILGLWRVEVLPITSSRRQSLTE